MEGMQDCGKCVYVADEDTTDMFGCPVGCMAEELVRKSFNSTEDWIETMSGGTPPEVCPMYKLPEHLESY